MTALLLPTLSALFSFLGGSAFRMIWGEVSAWLTKAQDHTFEIERMRLQKDLDDAAHAREMEALRLTNELKLQVVEAQRAADVDVEEAKAFTAAMADAFKPTGNFWVDLWNGIIRPACATIAIIIWVSKVWHQHGVMDGWDMDLVGAIFGFFFADRSLMKRGR